MFDKKDQNFATKGSKGTFKEGRLSVTNEARNAGTDSAAAKTEELRGQKSLKNSKSIDNLDKKKVFIGQLRIG